MAALDLRCYARVAISSYSWLQRPGFSRYRAQALGTRLQELRHVGSVVTHRLSCPLACGIFPDQGSNPSPVSHPLYHQEKSNGSYYTTNCETERTALFFYFHFCFVFQAARYRGPLIRALFSHLVPSVFGLPLPLPSSSRLSHNSSFF